MSIQKDLERLINEAFDAYEIVREKINEIQELADVDVEQHAPKFVAVSTALDDIYADIESLDA